MENDQFKKSARDIRVGYEVMELFAEADAVPETYRSPLSDSYDIAKGRDGRVVAVYHPMDKNDE